MFLLIGQKILTDIFTSILIQWEQFVVPKFDEILSEWRIIRGINTTCVLELNAESQGLNQW